jgi:hypothetical protein
MTLNLNEMQYYTPMSKYSMASMQTSAGDSSSAESIQSFDESGFVEMKMHSGETYTGPAATYMPTWTNQGCAPQNWNCSNTVGYQNLDHQCMPYADPSVPSARGREASVDPYHMPSTREPSLEPVWKNNVNTDFSAWKEEYVSEQYAQQSMAHQWSGAATPCAANEAHFTRQNQALGREMIRTSSRDMSSMQPDVNPSAQPYQTVLLVPQNQPVLFVRPGQGGLPQAGIPATGIPANGIPMNNGGVMPYPFQPVPMMPATQMPSGMPTTSAEPATQPNAAASDATPEADEHDQPTNWKSNGKNKHRGYFKSDSAFNKMSGEQKEALCKYIFDFMVKKNFTSQEGYLIVDVFSEVWKDMGDSAEGWRVAQHRFGHLLRSSPQYFRLFRRGIRVANQCGWFARKGEKMVRLVLDKEK